METLKLKEFIYEIEINMIKLKRWEYEYLFIKK